MSEQLECGRRGARQRRRWGGEGIATLKPRVRCWQLTNVEGTDPGAICVPHTPSSTAMLTTTSCPSPAPPVSLFLSFSRFEQLLDRVHRLHDTWIRGGHRRGVNTNNVSTTVSVREEEWDAVGSWMWHNRDAYNGLCVLPYSGHTYQQAPFEECSREVYEELCKHVTSIDLRDVREDYDGTSLQLALACAGADSCEL